MDVKVSLTLKYGAIYSFESVITKSGHRIMISRLDNPLVYFIR